jgi:hypothetical protein
LLWADSHDFPLTRAAGHGPDLRIGVTRDAETVLRAGRAGPPRYATFPVGGIGKRVPSGSALITQCATVLRDLVCRLSWIQRHIFGAPVPRFRFCPPLSTGDTFSARRRSHSEPRARRFASYLGDVAQEVADHVPSVARSGLLGRGSLQFPSRNSAYRFGTVRLAHHPFAHLKKRIFSLAQN